jgi:hypothetical protein
MKKAVSFLLLIFCVSSLTAPDYVNSLFFEKPGSDTKSSSGPKSSKSAGLSKLSAGSKGSKLTQQKSLEDKLKDLGATLYGKFHFVSQETGKVLEAISTGKHETLVQSASNGAASQIFTIYTTENGYYVLAANGRALTLDNFGAGNVVVFSEISKDEAQTWSYTVKTGSWGTLQSTVTNQAVDSTTVAQGVLTVFPNKLAATAKSSQLWTLVKSAC